MATKMKMVMKGGKMVPAFAADGKGKMQMGGVKKMQKGGSVDGPIEARRKIMGEKKSSLKKTLKYVKKNGSGYIPSNTKKMQYGGANMSLGPVTDFTKIPRPASTTTTTTPAPTPTPAPTSVKEAREQARIAKINAKAKGYADGTIVPGKNTSRIIDAGVEGVRLVNNVMQSRQNPGGMKKGGTMKPKMQMGGNTPPMQRPGQKKDTSSKPIDYSKIPSGVLPAGTVVDSYYSRNTGKNKIAKTIDKIKRLPINKRFLPARKMQEGGSIVKELLNPLNFAPPRARKVVGRESKNDKNIKLYNKKKPDGLSPNEIKKLKGMTPPSVRNKMQMGGGIPITGKAAARKVTKGKGMMTYNYGTSDAPGSDDNKGAYVKFAKKQTPNPYGGKTLQSRSRPVKKMGGATKKK